MEKDYNFKLKNNVEACGLDPEKMNAKQELFMGLTNGLNWNENAMAEFSSKLEENFSKREIAYMYSKIMFIEFEKALAAEGGKS